jgi:hypothetical protein
LHIARAKAKLATAKLSLLKSKARKQRRKLKEIAIIKNLEKLEDKAKILKNLLLFLLEPVKRTANSIILNPKLFANLG